MKRHKYIESITSKVRDLLKYDDRVISFINKAPQVKSDKYMGLQSLVWRYNDIELIVTNAAIQLIAYGRLIDNILVYNGFEELLQLETKIW